LQNISEIIAVVRDAKLLITFNSSTAIGIPFIAMKIRQKGKTLKVGLNYEGSTLVRVAGTLLPVGSM